MKRTFILLMSLFAMMAAGAGLKAQEITITLNPGWNWISYPNAAAMQVDEALGDFVPMEGDMIKSQNSFASYYSGSWSGGLTQFTPGWGYMYYSARTAPVLFAFSSPSTPIGALTVTTSTPADITATTVTCGGSAVSNDGTPMLMKGICWATHPLPTTYDAYSENGSESGAFTEELSELTPNTVYYVRAYAVSVKGVNYGIEVSFTTESDGSSEHEYVDLGLPSGTLWATCNIGASTPEGYGDYFAWGETQPKDEYSWNTYQYCNGNETTLTKYCSNSDYGYNGFTDNLTTLLPEDDAATATWGEDWRMPTKAEWQELYNNTTCTWTTQNGVAGRLFTATNGNSIFLPASGFRYVSSAYEAGNNGCYWSGTLDTGTPYNAWYLDFSFGNYSMGYLYGRSFGRSVRAVYSIQHNNNDAPTGAINGKFTINENGAQVYFSQGNLQYIGSASTPYWKFADNQWDYFGVTTGQNSDSVSVDRDLFGWGTSGYHDSGDLYNVNYQPWSTSSSTVNTTYNYYGYGPSKNMDSPDLTGNSANYDWGVYNPISNGGNQTNQWHTLSKSEWNYVFKTRTTSSGIRYAKAKVNDVNGVILLPDDWDPSYYTLNNTNSGGAGYSNNTITAEQWSVLEQYGAVFLPVAGYRRGTTVYDNYGDYWSVSYYNISSAWCLHFYGSSVSTGSTYTRDYGFSVRLVQGVQSYTINVASVNPIEGGTVTGDGTYLQGQNCTLTATANTGYAFVNWTENDSVVSTNPNYSFAVNANRTLVANFAVTPTGAINGLFSVNDSTQVYFSQGNLQYIGSASTPYWKFADNQWDYFGTATGQNSNAENVDRDLFGWGTSGYHDPNDPYNVNYQPWSISNATVNSDYNNHGYGPSTNMASPDLTGSSANYDWGVYNPISNGGNAQNSGWRTLTNQEWTYIFETRNTASGMRYTKATVNDVKGVILLPDEWHTSYYPLLVSTNNHNGNIISATEWSTLEQYGAVFLPAAGYRVTTSLSNAGAYGYYWSAMSSGSNAAHYVRFYSIYIEPDKNVARNYGLSVRLVRALE